MATLLVDDRKRFEAFQRNMDWFGRHCEELKKEYADQFVAINNQRVVDSETDANELINRLCKRHGDLRAFVIEPVFEGKVDLIL
jgi:hypothetical protein